LLQGAAEVGAGTCCERDPAPAGFPENRSSGLRNPRLGHLDRGAHPAALVRRVTIKEVDTNSPIKLVSGKTLIVTAILKVPAKNLNEAQVDAAPGWLPMRWGGAFRQVHLRSASHACWQKSADRRRAPSIAQRGLGKRAGAAQLRPKMDAA
jgi:hypothetical protein